MPNGRKIIVTANCTTYSLAAALAAYFPADTVTPVPWERADAPFIESLLACDILVADVFSDGFERLLEALTIDRASPPTLIKIARIHFAAFHPDLCYARDKKTGELVVPHYNSAIAAWAYTRNLSEEKTISLFCDNAYNDLGYYSAYQRDTHILKNSFMRGDLDFSEFFLSVKRLGLFMHSSNHPKIEAILKQALMIAEKIGLKRSNLGQEIGIPDGLNVFIWPVYPEIADRLALPHGSYNWRIHNKSYLGLAEYLRYCFATYRALGIGPDDLQPLYPNGTDQALYDRHLGALAKSRRRA